MASGDKCRECGTAIPADSPGGFCAQCLLGLGLATVQGASETTRKPEDQITNSLKPPIEAGSLPTARVVAAPPTEKPGDRIGRYRLIQEIGHGGCGVVYMAEQEEPVRRRVALKVIKLGMDTRQVVARFEAERQALALMDHPNIAKVLDAGATDNGRSYFVMELVSGIKITDYCDQNHLSTRDRLDLFIQVCRAIQHAHQKGIIHRDIKPSNVLVTTHDGVAVPKVIDFGIAKATQGRLTDQTLFTAFEQFIGTPAYMSPEQAQLGGLDIDTRSDIYSLGVLLYELLTGKTPFDAKELLASGLEAMRRTIREKEPLKPSTRLTQELVAADVRRRTSKIENQNLKSESKEPASSPRRLPTKELIHLLRGDLDWIVMKCLEKDRARRYETANGLARDIERHLSNEPVVASPPGHLYRLQKMIRRNKVLVSAGAAVVTVLVVGVIVSTWQAVRATRAEHQQSRLRQQAQTAQTNEVRERQNAQAEAAKSQQVTRFLDEMLKGAGPSKALGRDTTMLKEILDKTAQRVGKELTNQPLVEFEIRGILANVYDELGLYEQSERMARENLTLARSRLGEENAAVANALEKLGKAQLRLGNYDQAEKLLREAVVMRRKFSGDESLKTAWALNTLGMLHFDRGKYAEAEALQRQVLALFRKRLGNEHADVALILQNLAASLQGQGKLEEAETLHRQALAMQRKLLGNEHPDVALSLSNLAHLLVKRGKDGEAEAMYREALTMRRKVLGGEHPDIARALEALGGIQSRHGKLDEAEALQREALEMNRNLHGNDHRAVAHSLHTVGYLLFEQGKLDEAETMLRQALAMQRKLLGNEHPDVAISVIDLALLLQKAGKFGDVETLYRDHLPGLRAGLPENPLLANALAAFTSTLLSEKKFAEAEPIVRECLSIREKKIPDDWRTFSAKSMLGSSLLGQTNYSDAEPFLISGYEGLKQREAKVPDGSKSTVTSLIKGGIQNLAQLYDATGRPDQAVGWKKKLEDFESTQSDKQPPAALPAKPSR